MTRNILLMPQQYHGYETHRVIFFIHAVSNEVSSVILVHAQGLDSVACVAPCALHLNGRIFMLMRHLQAQRLTLHLQLGWKGNGNGNGNGNRNWNGNGSGSSRS